MKNVIDCRKKLWQTKTSLHWNKHKIHFFHCVFLHSFIRFALLILQSCSTLFFFNGSVLPDWRISATSCLLSNSRHPQMCRGWKHINFLCIFTFLRFSSFSNFGCKPYLWVFNLSGIFSYNFFLKDPHKNEAKLHACKRSKNQHYFIILCKIANKVISFCEAHWR